MRARDGFTLLEAVISLAILGLVGLSALGAVGRDLDAAGRSRAALESAALAEDRLEAVRLLDHAELSALPDSVARGRFPPPLDEYQWAVDVETVGDAPGLFDATVVVSWESGEYPLRARLYRPLAIGATP